MNSDTRQLRARNLRTIGALSAVFVLPLLIAFWMYYGGGWIPASRTNHGELLEPVRPLPLERWREAAPLAEHWALVYISPGRCEQRCRDALLVLRQTRLSLNQEMDRVVRVLIAGADCCDREFLEQEHKGLIVLDADTEGARKALPVFPSDRQADSIFLIDPLGNLVMRFDSRSDPKGLLTDLRKLLKLSHIG
jgi:hypothetical protein